MKDIDGVEIVEGSVLSNVLDGESGVVVKIMQEGDFGTCFDSVGDLKIQTGFGTYRCTNCYRDWRHVSRSDQTYSQRLLSWRIRPYDSFIYPEDMSRAEGVCLDGIMSLLPSDPVDWDFGPFPDNIESVLGFLVSHLEEITKPKVEVKSECDCKCKSKCCRKSCL
jgi:hypothetical protein